MKRNLSLLASLFASTLLFAQVPEASEDVMLQGFYWESQNETGWTQLMESVDEIGSNFTCIWLPPSASAEGSNTVGGTNVGYHPRVWNNQNSCWGTADDLKSLISSLHDVDVKVLADIVINHRAGYTDWCNFPEDDFGEYGKFQLTGADICSTDETNSNHKEGEAYGAADTGDNWDGARDLDHSSANVQNDVKAYLKWLKGEIGYDGFRYDLVKGFSGSYIGIYNDASNPYISVGEYWDSSYDNVWGWINSTGKKSMAFDFPAKYALFNNGLAQGNFGNMMWTADFDSSKPRPAGLIHHYQSDRYAVTFVDNHDTYRDASKFTGDWAQAYAVLLSAPGIPCVFWPHWTACKDVISQQIAARHAAGIHSQSVVKVTCCNSYYECYAEGKNGTLICRVGNAAPSDVPEGYYLACGSSDWYYFLPNCISLPTAIDAHGNNISVYLNGNVLNVVADKEVNVLVSSLDGRILLRKSGVEHLCSTLPRGLNIVRVDNKEYKFIIK